MGFIMAKKKKKSAKLSAAMFKTTGAHAKLKVDAKKKKLFYFGTKVKPDKAGKLAAATGAEILGVSPSALKVGKPALKYDFYSIYDATVNMKYVTVDVQELGVYDQLKGAMVGKEVVLPKKGKTIPGKAIFVDIVNLYFTKNKVSHILDGSTGHPARSLEKMLKGPGKKGASPAWIRKNKITSGKFNSVEKVLKAIVKEAGKVSKDIKRVVERSVVFSKLDSFYVPTYYVTVTAGAKSKVMRVNGVTGNVAIKV